MGAASAVACVPWILFFIPRKEITAGMLATMVFVGALAETSNFIRSHSETGLALFALVVILSLYQMRLCRRLVLVTCLLLGMAAPALLFHHLYARRDSFLWQQPNALIEVARGHPFWHSVYIGLGWVKNSEVPAYLDAVAAAKVHELRPDAEYCSPEYEHVLRDQVIGLAKRRPFLILGNLFLKLGVVLMTCLWAANVGLYATGLTRKPLALEAAFWLAIGFNALPAILVVPILAYLMGLIVFAAMYGAYSVEYAARNPEASGRLRWLRLLFFAAAWKHATSA